MQQNVITDSFNPANAQTCAYAHDDLIRLASVTCTNNTTNVWAQTFGYDPLGNLSKFLVTGYPGVSFTPTYSTSTNRITSAPFTYDANGNTTQDNVHSYTWDAEGKPVTLDSVGATYDALGRMVEQNRSGTYTQIVYSLDGSKLALFNGATLVNAFLPLPQGAVAEYPASQGYTMNIRHPDWLGSSRISSDPNHNIVSDLAYAPFGETYAESGTPDRAFTGQNQDTIPGSTAGLYDFLFREYAQYGRWISPDPAGGASVAPTAPQTWNRYGYVANNPLSATDPLGLDMCLTGGLCETTFAGSDPALGTGQVMVDGSPMNASVAAVAMGTGLAVPGPAGWGFAKDSNGNVHGYFTYAALDGNGGVFLYNQYAGVNAPAEIGLPGVLGAADSVSVEYVVKKPGRGGHGPQPQGRRPRLFFSIRELNCDNNPENVWATLGSQGDYVGNGPPPGIDPLSIVASTALTPGVSGNRFVTLNGNPQQTIGGFVWTQSLSINSFTTGSIDWTVSNKQGGQVLVAETQALVCKNPVQ